MIKWKGMTFRLHPLFVLVLLGSIATGYLTEVAVLFAIVLIHELGHVAAARTFGWNVVAVELLPFGGVAVMDKPGAVPAREDIIVALAGPLQNVMMILFAFAMSYFGLWSEAWSQYFIRANEMIALFNLLPILPLDGGRVLQSLCSLWLSFHRTIVLTYVSSLAFSFLLIGYALVHIAFGGIPLNLLAIGMFLLYSNWYAYRNVPFYFMRFLMDREYRTIPLIARGTLAQPIVVGRQRGVGAILRLFMRERYHLIYVMNEQGKIVAVLPEQRLIQTYFQKP